MPTQIVMPQLGESVAEGVIGKWLKVEGDSIAKDEPIVEVVTDKVNAEIPSPVAGVLQKISAQEGATVAVGQEIAVIADADAGSAGASGPGQSAAQASIGAAASPQGPGAGGPAEGSSEQPRGGAATSVMAPPAPSDAESSPAPAPTTSGINSSSQAVSAAMTEENGGNGARAVRTSPLVQRLAAEHNVDLSRVPGTGIGGRVSKKDILQYIQQMQQQPSLQTAVEPVQAAPPQDDAVAQQRTMQPVPTVTPPPQPMPEPQAAPAPAETSAGGRQLGPNEEAIPISPVRRMIAAHMVKSKFTIPHATTLVEVDMTPVVRYRDAQKQRWQQREGVPLSFMAFVAKATVEALKEYPLVNSEWADDAIILKKQINLGMAVAAQDGLIVPNIKNADRLSTAGLAHAIHDLATRARARKLTPDDVNGGTFTLNNTGALGSVVSVSIINYPQAGILSADAIVKRPWVMPDDAIAIRHIMNLCMSFDHRILDGATVADFMQFIRRRLESWSPDASLY